MADQMFYDQKPIKLNRLVTTNTSTAALSRIESTAPGTDLKLFFPLKLSYTGSAKKSTSIKRSPYRCQKVFYRGPFRCRFSIFRFCRSVCIFYLTDEMRLPILLKKVLIIN